MTLRAGVLAASVLVLTATTAGTWFFLQSQRSGATPPARPAPASAGATAADARKIKARLFYVAGSGRVLTSVERDVPYGEGLVAQARAILTAQLEPVEAPLVSAIPAGTALRALFVTPEGDAYADFSRELVTAHPRGSMSERLTVHTIVEALAGNLSAIRAVQILVDGQEVDTLAGHLDLRRPMRLEADWVE
jgi:hypothetical protein